MLNVDGESGKYPEFKGNVAAVYTHPLSKGGSSGGHYDGIAPVSNQEALASQIPNATLELFDGGHLFLMQDAKAFPRIVEFLEGTS